MPTYQEALDLFHEWTSSESLRRHAYAVEASMAHYARLFGEDEEAWRITGLLHEMDYEKHPSIEEHPFVGVNGLKAKGYGDDITTAILGHATSSCVARQTLMAKTRRYGALPDSCTTWTMRSTRQSRSIRSWGSTC